MSHPAPEVGGARQDAASPNSGHLHFVDPDLSQYDEVWAAAGRWNDVFPIAPADLVRASGVVTDLERS